MNNDSLLKIKAIIRSLLVSNRNQHTNLQELQNDYIRNEGTPIPYDKFGYPTLVDFFQSMPDVLKIDGSDINASIEVVSIPNVQHIEHLMQKTTKRSRANWRGTQKKRTIKMNNPSSYNTPAKPQQQASHHRTPKKEVTWKENKTSHNTIGDSSPPKKVPIRKIELRGNTELASCCDHTNEMLNSSTPSCTDVDLINMLDVPKNIMPIGSTIPAPVLTQFLNTKGKLLVRVLYVVNPNRIWIRCSAHQHSFEKLQLEMYNHYNEQYNNGKYVKPTSAFQGLYCAAMWEGQWCRAKIVAPVIGSRVKLNFFDIGVVEYVDLSCVQYLSSVFSNPNVMAVRASLAFLAPRRHQWSRADSDILEQMLSKSELLCADIVGFDQTNNALEIILQGASMANINKTFASTIDATYLGKEPLSDIDYNAYRMRSRTFNEKYPTFGCIEEGHFPSLSELRRSLARNFDFEQFYAQIPHNPQINIPQQFRLTKDRVKEIMSSSRNTSQVNDGSQ